MVGREGWRWGAKGRRRARREPPWVEVKDGGGIEETIRGFNMIMNGEVDQYPEGAFNLVGTIDDAIEKGKKMMAEAQN